AFVETAVTADAGKAITINFKNTGALEHSLIFDLPPAGDKAGDVGIPKDWANNLRGITPGKSETLQLPALDAGTYKYYCHVPGHETMVGTLTVK
ncbi:MAG: cupredoxin domain-containing protein, partial [Anaerolineae bacterium]|nr:cupredoxin domain-containing protein [Anaerolineae bacterium]